MEVRRDLRPVVVVVGDDGIMKAVVVRNAVAVVDAAKNARVEEGGGTGSILL